MCCKTWQKKQSYHICHYIFELSRYVLFLYIFLKNLSKSQKSLEEYFSSPFRCIYSIYIHSWALIWHPFRKWFLLIVWKECLTSIIHFFHTASHSAADHCRFQHIKHFQKQLCSSSNFNIPFFKHFQYWMFSTDPRFYGTGNHVGTDNWQRSILRPSQDTFGLIQLRCTMTHTKQSIQVNV